MATKKPPPKRKRGRPKFKFDAAQIEDLEKLAGLLCTQKEVAGFFGVHEQTFRKALDEDQVAADAWEHGREKGKLTLRRNQFRLSEKNATMAIFLGKQILGQKDDPEETPEGETPDDFARAIVGSISEIEAATAPPPPPVESGDADA